MIAAKCLKCGCTKGVLVAQNRHYCRGFRVNMAQYFGGNAHCSLLMARRAVPRVSSSLKIVIIGRFSESIWLNIMVVINPVHFV